MKSRFINDTIQKINVEGVKNSAAKIISSTSILFVVRSGILRRILPVSIAPPGITVNQDLQSFRPHSHNINFIYWYCIYQEQNIRELCAKDGTTVESVDVSKLKSYGCPILGFDEQNIIEEILENTFLCIEKLENDVEKMKNQAITLRQSILKKAFSGELVSQDANDEPATVLLECIKAEKEIPRPKKRNPNNSKRSPYEHSINCIQGLELLYHFTR